MFRPGYKACYVKEYFVHNFLHVFDLPLTFEMTMRGLFISLTTISCPNLVSSAVSCI